MRVAHFEPDKITVTGEGVFPRVIFDLPADKEDYRYEEMAKQAHQSLGRENSNLSDKSVGDVPFRALADVSSTLIEHITLTAPPPPQQYRSTLSPDKDLPYAVETSRSIARGAFDWEIWS